MRSRSRRHQHKHPPLSKRTYIGRIQKNPRGFAFVLSEERGGADVYVPKSEATFLLNSDKVEYRVHRDGKRSNAEIIRILERGQTEILGLVHKWRNVYVVAINEYGAFLLDRTTANPPLGEWVIARFVRYPTREQDGVVAIKDVLGAQLLPKHDIEITVAKYGIETGYDEAAVREAQDLRKECERELCSPSKKRKDLRALPFVTIDGETAKDFDDAVLVDTSDKKSAFILYVAIADVSFFVREQTLLDKAARRRGTSVYFPGTAIPMLPEVLSNDLCSLNPKTDKLTLTAEMHMDREGNVTASHFYESIIRTAARLTYNDVHDFNEDKKPIPPELEEPMKAAYALFRKMRIQRKSRGVLDFDLPESEIELNSEGEPIDIHRAMRHDSHKLIEEFMIAANREVAKRLRETKTPAVYRVHEAPEPTTLDEVNMLMRHLGISHRIHDLNPKSLSGLLEATKSIKGSKTLHKAILRLQKQARYMADPHGHFGLALRDYTHFTSPIRRYPDLIVHRALKGLIAGKRDSDNRYEENYFEAVGAECSDRERRAMEAERFIVKRKHCWFMLKHVGKDFSGQVAGVTANGAFVELPEFAIEGFIPLDKMAGRYEFDESRVCLRQRPGKKVVSLGDSIAITVADVSLEDNDITFAEKG